MYTAQAIPGMQGAFRALLPRQLVAGGDTRADRGPPRAATTSREVEGNHAMSHAGPPEPPQPDPDQPGADQPEAGGSPDEAGSPGPGEQPWSPYPTGWDQRQSSTPPPPAYGGAQGQQPAPYQQGPHQQGPYQQSPYEQSPYGQPSPYQQVPYGAATPANPYAGAPRADRPVFGFGGYAGWFARAGAMVIDYLLYLLAGLPSLIANVILLQDSTTTTDAQGVTHLHYHYTTATSLLLLIGTITGLSFGVWNICIRQGRTGATIGKSVLAIRLVNSDLQPIGGGWAALRFLLHIVDLLPFCVWLGFLWPIWDSRKQTFADKIMSTYVIHATQQQPQPY